MSFAASRAPVALFALVIPACTLRSPTLARDTSGAEDVNGTESDLEVLGSSLVDSSGQSLATSSFAPGSGEIRTLGDVSTTGNPGFWFEPAGCLQITTDTSTQTATYAFNGCTGPLGLVSIQGTVTVTWVLASGALTLNYSAQNFEINRATIDTWQATAVITANLDERDMAWNAELSGVTGSGRQFTRTNQMDVTWTVGQPCLSLSGVSSGTITGADLQTTVTAYERCADECPQAGSEIEVKNLDNGESIAITYEGGPEALLTIDGKSETITLACGN